MTALPSHLGYDDTVSRVVVDDTEQFEFKVSVPESDLPIIYRTVNVLSNYVADRILGKATRVWVVQRETDESARKRDMQSTRSDRQFGDKRYVLKDLWVEEGRKREGEFYREIHDAIAELPEGERATARRHFLTIDSCCEVSTSSTHGKLATNCSNMLKEDASRITLSPPPTFSHSCTGSATIGFPGPAPVLKDEVRMELRTRPVNRSHYRIVFREVGTPYNGLHRMGECIHTLVGACYSELLLVRLLIAHEQCLALFYLLSLKGWIHRDVSAANILNVDGNGVLHDFEYITDMPKQYGLKTDSPFYKIPFTVVSSTSCNASIFLLKSIGY
jgi:hypothetical protein